MMIPLGLSGGFHVMVILKYEGNDVIITNPGAAEIVREMKYTKTDYENTHYLL